MKFTVSYKNDNNNFTEGFIDVSAMMKYTNALQPPANSLKPAAYCVLLISKTYPNFTKY
jgi:hypothetical protein